MFKVIDLVKAEALGFKKDSCHYTPEQYVYKDSFLCIDADTGLVNILSGVDYICGDEELEGFYKLIKAGIIEER